jgi:hypothetical protein
MAYDRRRYGVRQAPYDRAGERWNRTEETTACQLFREGKGVTEIALRIHRDPAAVCHKLIEFGIIGFIDSEDRYTERSYMGWTDDEKERLNQEFRSGKSIDEIAKIHQRYRNAIFHRLIKQKQFDITDRNLLLKYTNHNRHDQNSDNMVGNDKAAPIVEYKPTKEKVNLIDRLLKRTDPVFWQKIVQGELDKRWAAFDTTADKLRNDFEKFNRQAMEITEAEHNVQTTEKEWAESLTSLGNLLNKNASHEKQMWETTQKNRKAGNFKIKQKFNDSDVDEIRFNNMMEYIKQYPELQMQKTVDRLIDNVKDKRNEIVSVNKVYREAIKETNVYLNIAKNKLQEVQDELVAFEKMKMEGEQKVNEAQTKGLINKIINSTRTAAEKESTKLNFFAYDRKIDVSKNQLKLIEKRLREYENRKFMPIVTQKFEDIE